MAGTYDRSTEDIANIVALEHVNVRVPDQRLATIFYMTGMGFTRDPYIMSGVVNMWVNIGRCQIHMPTGEPQVLRGHLGLVVPDREALLRRLSAVRADLDGTRFAVSEEEDYVEVVSPWGNRMRCHEPAERFGRINLGMPYVEFEVPVGAAAGIARFYREVMGTRAALVEDELGRRAVCSVGDRQEFVFRESERPLPDYDGHHVQVYLADFSGPHRRLEELGLVFEESDRWQYRFRDIVDPETKEIVFTIEHEIRSMTHPLFGRVLVNRDPERSNQNFAAGGEDWHWALPAGGR